jgi:hypothetical protein
MVINGETMKSKNADIAITPETKVGALLDNFPQLESILIKLAPAFAKLRNPILRKTVARVTTLRQAARIGNVPLANIINSLRREAGVDKVFSEEAEPSEAMPQPEWFDSSRISKRLDARKLIEDGRQPLEIVTKDLKNIGPSQIYELITPFVPAPLIDIVRRRGYDVWVDERKPETIRTYITPVQEN